jgi:DNA modification methylase
VEESMRREPDSGKMKINYIQQGDSLEVLRTFDNESIDCCVTSPPYWALRDYGVSGQLGNEKTFDEYIIKLCDIFDEVKRTLKKEGTCWVNIGDTYFGGCGGPSGWERKSRGIEWMQKVKGILIEGTKDIHPSALH